jgi:selenocysteine-specific elongation factor
MDIGPLTVGTAGHVDHGKTELVRELTGVDTDRLAEEKARGMSIVLGYAPLQLPNGRRISLIDVPGHQRLIRAMISGATGIDIFLMVVAADDGVMPQTIEHARILAALDVHRGVLAVTKCDLADPSRAIEQATKLLPSATIVACSARTGTGIDRVAESLQAVAGDAPSRSRDALAPAVLHIDRVFSLRGIGTVVTGTLWAGSVGAGDELTLIPAERKVRVRGVQVHEQARPKAQAGQRVAINLAGRGHLQASRGDVLVGSGSEVKPSCTLDARLALHEIIRPRDLVIVYHGTRQTSARILDLTSGLWRLHTAQPLLAVTGDHVVLRRANPPSTLGGGTIVNPLALPPGKRAETIERLRRPRSGEHKQQRQKASTVSPASALDPGTSRVLSPGALELEGQLRDAGCRPPTRSELCASLDDLAALCEIGRAIRVGREMYTHPDVIAEVRTCVENVIAAEGSIRLARLRDELGISRRYAQALLEHLDAIRATRRLFDDSRVLRRPPVS